MASFEIRPAVINDLVRLTSLDHSTLSDYVWQLELRREAGQTIANFREVRLPRPRDRSVVAAPEFIALREQVWHDLFDQPGGNGARAQ